MRQKRLAEAWKDYERHVPDPLRADMRMAFFTGAAEFWRAVRANSPAGDTDFSALQDAIDEVAEFAKEMGLK
jgi:hypothetical protein